MTRYGEVIGQPVAQSKSPAIHSHWLARAGIDAEYRYQTVIEPLLKPYLDERRDDPNWCGCNITMPLKMSAPAYCDRLDPGAEKLDAVNLVVREGADLVGYNTDGEGFLEPLRDRLSERHLFRMARVMGTGGAARAICSALADKGFVLVVAGRDPGRANRMIEALGLPGDHHTAAIAQFAGPTDFPFDEREGCCDLVVNATPLGMRGHDPLPFDISHAPPGSIFYDIVTDPIDTPFLEAARAAGFETIDGRAMLLGQAAVSFEKMFGQAPDRRADQALLESLV
ncbi:shikimate dehydrogenase family protein [Pseudoblastomonas halimionae]|uniref:Shikimate dehydrogenase n=1 Tax=Alteriqipengyuania halimionae TaxID=1926630 RepID=A0A6I4U407_9SPHN|nr:shikimate dehydrogenase [Alteriqipengyuania halimionae]MXP10839.1 shikimate dehydrogenase [Alteriqipengyuania halimionae]